MNFLFGSNKAFFGIIIVASVVIALMMVIAKGVVTYGLELMMAVFQIVQGAISKIMRTSGLGGASTTKLPNVPIPLATFAGQPTQNVGKSFVKSYTAVCLEGAIIVLACVIFSIYGR